MRIGYFFYLLSAANLRALPYFTLQLLRTSKIFLVYMCAEFMFHRRLRGPRRMLQLICGRFIPRAFVPWMFVCFALVLLRFLWLRSVVIDLQLNEVHQERVLAHEAVVRYVS